MPSCRRPNLESHHEANLTTEARRHGELPGEIKPKTFETRRNGGSGGLAFQFWQLPDFGNFGNSPCLRASVVRFVFLRGENRVPGLPKSSRAWTISILSNWRR